LNIETVMHDAMRVVAPWLHLALDHVYGFVGLLFFSFFGLLGALNKFKFRMLPLLIGATIVWALAGAVVIVREISLLGPANLLKPHGGEAILAAQFIKRMSSTWFAGSTLGAGLIAITMLFERYSKSRPIQFATLVMRTAVFAVALWIYLRTYVLRG
jgi:hypothetical protein